MATSFIQMAYSLTDMAWVGRLGSESMAAVGAVGILTWMSGSIALLNKVGAEVSVGQSIGARSEEDARSFASHNITIALLISVCWGGLLFLFARPNPEHLRAETAYHGRRRDLSAHRVDGTAFHLSLRCLYGHLQRGRTKQDSVLHQRDGTDNEHRPRPSVHLRLRLGNSGRGTCHMAFRSYSIRHLRLQTPGGKAPCSEVSPLSFR